MLVSDRLILRPFEENDAEGCPWFRDPKVMRWIPGGPDANLSVTAKRIAKYREHFKRHGFSKYVILERNSGVAIGDSGIMYLADTDMIELGYRIAPEFQGLGYATEAARSVLARIADLGIKEVWAIVHPENDRSRVIIEQRLDFSFKGNYVYLRTMMNLYKKRLDHVRS